LLQHMTRPPTPPRALDPAIPPAVEAAILRALEKEPPKRFQRIEDMLAALGIQRALTAPTGVPVVALEPPPAAPSLAAGPRAAPGRRRFRARPAAPSSDGSRARLQNRIALDHLRRRPDADGRAAARLRRPPGRGFARAAAARRHAARAAAARGRPRGDGDAGD